MNNDSNDDSADSLSKFHSHLTTTPPLCTSDLPGDKNMTLHRACQDGELCVVQYIMSRGLEHMNSRGFSGRTPVMVAARWGRGEVFDFLVSHNSDLSGTDDYKHNVLHLACKGGNIDIVQTLIVNEQFDMESKGWQGITPVMCAAWYGNKGVFDFLVSQDCDLSVIGLDNENVLHLACVGGNVGIVQTLIINKSFNCEIRGRKGMTPLMYAARLGHGEVFDFLVSQGCDLSGTNTLNNTILHFACKGGNAEIVETLIHKEQFDIEDKGEREMTPVMTAVHSGHRSVFHLLVSKGCNLTAKDKNDMNILHYACLGGQVDVVEYIISHNTADIDSRDDDEETPLMKAVLGGHIQVVNLLLKKGCSPTALDVHGNNILHLACFMGCVDMVNYILEKDIVNMEERNNKLRTPLLIAAASGHKGAFKALDSKGCSMRVRDYRGNNILHRACTGGRVGIVKYILTQNVVSIESRNSNGQTPLLIAAASGYTRVVKILVNNGCNHSARDQNKNNILHVACIGGHVEMVEYILIMKYVGIDSTGFQARTPVLQAAMYGQRSIVNVLLNKGCNPTTSDDQKNNMLHLACSFGQYKVVKFILKNHIVGIDSKGMKRRTPVMTAVLKKEHMEIVKLLVNQGCDLKAVDDAGNSVLHLACARDHVDMVSYMIRHGDVDYKQKNKGGMTPLQLAESKHLTSMSNLLKARE